MRKCWSCMTRSPSTPTPSPQRVAAATVIQRKFRERQERRRLPSRNENKMRILWVLSKSPHMPKTQNIGESILRKAKLPTRGFNRRRLAHGELNNRNFNRNNSYTRYVNRLGRNMLSRNKERVLYALIRLYHEAHWVKNARINPANNDDVLRVRRWINRIHTAYRRVHPGKGPINRLTPRELYTFFQTLPVNNLRYIGHGIPWYG